MANTGQQFAFVVGEVSQSFYGRSDLTKYPLGLATCENFLVNYKGGLINRPGHEFVAALELQDFRMARFKAPGDDYVLLFLPGKMLIARTGGFVLDSITASVSDTAGRYECAGIAEGDYVFVEHDSYPGVHQASSVSGDTFALTTVFGDVITGPVVLTKVFQLATPITSSLLPGMQFTQDNASVVCTSGETPTIYLEYIDDTTWTVSTGVDSLPSGPATVTGTATGTGTASTSYTVTAVVDDVESKAGELRVLTSIVNFTTTTGSVALSWGAVPGADYYNLYRSLVFPNSPFPTGAEMGYIGKTEGTTFQDMNITPDFTKTISSDPDYFADGNYPALYARFQQRGVYSGLANAPLAVVSSISRKRKLFSVTTPVLATDSYSYEVDAISLRPIKHMVPLRYGLMLFTDDAVFQLYGGSETRALTATSAQVDVQTFTSVSDMPPIVVNLDLLYMSALGTEFNAMLYTEYTNSFKTQDVLVLSSHLFGPDNMAVAGEYAAEPHKLINFIREDGQRVTLTYERSQEVYGWARQCTNGAYLDLCTVREGNYNLPYYMIRRRLRGKWVMVLERDKPRRTAYKDQWFVDCGAELAPATGNFTVQLVSASDSHWQLSCVNNTDVLPFAVDDLVYFADGYGVAESIDDGVATIRQLSPPRLKANCKQYHYLSAGTWHYNTPVSEITGLWWLEGETVSVLADGDGYINLTVVDGTVELVNAAGRVVCGLPYTSTFQTLPLGLEGYNVNGEALALRGVSTRLINTRGLSLGTSAAGLEELPSATFTDWGAAMEQSVGLYTFQLMGGDGWDSDAAIVGQQVYPLAVEVLGLTYQLDVG